MHSSQRPTTEFGASLARLFLLKKGVAVPEWQGAGQPQGTLPQLPQLRWPATYGAGAGATRTGEQ